MPFTPNDYLPYDFANLRHIGPSKSEISGMLDYLKVASLDELIDQTVPKSIRQKEQSVHHHDRAGVPWHHHAPRNSAQYP